LPLPVFVQFSTVPDVKSEQFSAPDIDAFNQQFALVIGNGAYESSPLRNPAKRCDGHGSSPKSVGFKVL